METTETNEQAGAPAEELNTQGQVTEGTPTVAEEGKTTEQQAPTETTQQETAEKTIDPEVVLEDDGTTEVPPTVDQTTSAKVQSSVLQQLLDELKESGTVYEKALVNSLEAYSAKMAPGIPIDVEVGAHEQWVLWSTLRSVIQSAPDEEFKRLWSIVLAYAEEHKDGAFTEGCLFRFSEYWRFDLEELAGFHRILNLIKATSNIDTRAKSLRTVDLTRTLDKGISERGRSRLVSFYQ
jgi:hypothetical protein